MSAIDRHSENSAGFRLAVVVEGAIGLAAVGLAALFGISLGGQFAAAPVELLKSAQIGTLAVLPMLALFGWMVLSQRRPFVELKRIVTSMVGELFPRARLAELALIAALAGVGEELLFRGFLQTLVAKYSTPVVGIVVASLVFGALHAISRLYFVLATLIGGYLGWLLIASGDLTVPIVAHGLYDFVALVYLTRQTEREHPK